MRRLLLAIMIPFVALTGLALGALTAPNAHALVGYGLWVNPGGSTNALTCGWHDTCKSPWPWGNALD
jgi:hypothetical protein